MNLRIRITFGFLIIVLIMVSMAGIIIWQESKMQRAFQQSIHISEIDKYFLECRRQEKNYLIRHDSGSIELYKQYYDALINKVNETVKLGLSDKSLRIVVALQKNLEEYNKKFMEIIDPIKELDEIKIVREVELAREIHTSISELNKMAIDNFDKAHILTININIFSILIGFFLSIVIAGFISTKIMDIIRDPNDYLQTNH